MSNNTPNLNLAHFLVSCGKLLINDEALTKG